MSGALVATALVLAAMASASPLAAQSADSLLATRLDPTIRTQIESLIATARADSLPVAPLVSKALEGSSKGAPAPRILAAVQALAGHLGAARQALGRDATDEEIAIGADALRAGAQPSTLRYLRAAAGTRRLTVPLTVLAALVERGVPVETAVTAVTGLAGRHASDRDYVNLQHAIERDIGAGTPSAAAATAAGAQARSNSEPGTPPKKGHSKHPSRRD